MDVQFWFWFWLVFLLGTAISSESTTMTPEGTTEPLASGIPTQATTDPPTPNTLPTTTVNPGVVTAPNTTTPTPNTTPPTPPTPNTTPIPTTSPTPNTTPTTPPSSPTPNTTPPSSPTPNTTPTTPPNTTPTTHPSSPTPNTTPTTPPTPNTTPTTPPSSPTPNTTPTTPPTPNTTPTTPPTPNTTPTTPPSYPTPNTTPTTPPNPPTPTTTPPPTTITVNPGVVTAPNTTPPTPNTTPTPTTSPTPNTTPTTPPTPNTSPTTPPTPNTSPATTTPPSSPTPNTTPTTPPTPNTFPPTTTTVNPGVVTAPNTTSPTPNTTPPPTTTTPNTPTTCPQSPTTPPTSDPPTTTTTLLVCSNGGLVLDGVCICPDEWTGETCSVANFCSSQQLDGFQFPATPVGWFSYSEEVCLQGTSAAGKPEASTRCLSNNGSPSFDRPQVLQCDQTLSDIQQNLTSAADLEILATSTQILTSRPEELTSENVTAAARIANTLLLSPNATESVRVAAVATVSQLLNASVLDNAAEDNTTLSLTVTLDQLSVTLSLSQNTSQSQVVQPNLVVQSAQIPPADTQGVQFTSFTGTSGSFVADRIQLNTNTSDVTIENGFIADALIYVRFPAAVSRRQSPSNVSLGFVLYQNDRFFQSRLYMRRRASVRVLSASVHGQDHNVTPQHVEMMFRPTLPNGSALYDFSCVFWSFSLQDWSTVGCSKGNASDGVLRCFCNHTTNFAALWSFRENYEYAAALGVISIIGLSFSILGLVVTIIFYIREKFWRKSSEKKLLNSELAVLCICCSLLAFIITFLSGVHNSSRPSDGEPAVNDQTNEVLQSDQHVEPDRGSCTAVAVLLHFFLLATFTWTSLYGTQLMLLVRSMRRSLPPYWTALSMTVGWGIPVVVMASTLAVTYRVDHPLGYRQEEFCWLAALDQNKQFSFGKPMFWGFILPVGLILIYNIVLLILTSLTTCRVDPNLTSTNQLSLTRRVLVSFSLAVMFGLSWTLGYLVLVTTGPAHLVISIIFCILTTTQGFQIFVLFTVRTPAFKAAIQHSVRSVSSISLPLTTKTYNLWKDEWKSSGTETYREMKESESL
ncbi:adhesion G-protein coupled receptor G7 isoform X2 [Amphiprion ocellaris]|uniref:adhesion G-protein coupled receptor G7 isoform X2 n=1 Tax=Amphiprion ocellaris TaxID=80972 RepID=UPI0024114C43|nr:adhesion G-protein coupled receptor G7 isoform X2 [Amphiprion ocellaris]